MFVFTFDNFSFGVVFACLNLVIGCRVDLETVLFRFVVDLAHVHILEWYDAARLFVGRELEVVEAAVVQDEPATFPRLVAAALFPQPALFDRIVECQHEVVAVVDGKLERLFFNAIVTVLFYDLININ